MGERTSLIFVFSIACAVRRESHLLDRLTGEGKQIGGIHGVELEHDD